MGITAPLRLGQVLAGKYRIEEPMTAGGFAVLFRGVRLADELPVAVKALRYDSVESDPAAVERFVREAAIAATLRHPHLVQILDFGQTRDDILYMVMELLQGEPLSERIAGRPLPPVQARHILLQLLEALHYAHGEKLVHRDLKPSNVFLCHQAPEGAALDEAHGVDWVKVLDFGVAKGLHHAVANMRVTLTAEGARVGTPGYMAPELVNPAARPTQQVDLYAAGVIGYEMLTGRHAFPGKGWARFAAMLDGDPPDPPGALAHHPLTYVVQQLMARRPSERYRLAEEAIQDLQELDPEDPVLFP